MCLSEESNHVFHSDEQSDLKLSCAYHCTLLIKGIEYVCVALTLFVTMLNEQCMCSQSLIDFYSIGKHYMLT